MNYYFIDKIIGNKDLSSFKSKGQDNEKGFQLTLDDIFSSDGKSSYPHPFDKDLKEKEDENSNDFSDVITIINNIPSSIPQTGQLYNQFSFDFQSKPLLLTGDTEDSEREITNYFIINFFENSFYLTQNHITNTDLVSFVKSRIKKNQINREQTIDHIKKYGWYKFAFKNYLKEEVIQELVPFLEIDYIIKNQVVSEGFLNQFHDEINFFCNSRLLNNFKWCYFMNFIKLKLEESINYSDLSIIYVHPSLIDQFKNEIYFYDNFFFDNEIYFKIVNKSGEKDYFKYEGHFKNKIFVYSSYFIHEDKILFFKGLSSNWRNLKVKKMIPLREREYCFLYDLMIDFDQLELFDLNAMFNIRKFFNN